MASTSDAMIASTISPCRSISRNGRRDSLCIQITFILIACFCCMETSLAQINWIGGTGDFLANDNWRGGVPLGSVPFSINNGGTAILTGEAATTNTGLLGIDPNVNGQLLISGAGQLATGSFYVGYAGIGTLQLSDGGRLTSSLGMVARNVGSIGTITVTGTGSSWISSGEMTLSQSGSASLTVTNGGFVEAQNIVMAEEEAGISTVIVTGSGSRLSIKSTLEVGTAGKGNLDITNGGIVSTVTTTAINLLATGVGKATVSGAGSRMEVGTALYLGYLGNGDLSISNGGLVSVGTFAEIGVLGGASGTLHLNDGGTLEVGGVDGLRKGKGSAAINFNGGTLRVKGSALTTSVDTKLANNTTIDTNALQATLSGVLSGTGGLIKSGAGKLTLSAANSYTGSTAIHSGTLALKGVGRLGAGNLVMKGGNLDITEIQTATYSFNISQTLRGWGTINATGKTLLLAGTFDSGDNPGTLAVTGDFTLQSTAILNFTINQANERQFDQLAVNGRLVFDGTLNLTTNYNAGFGDSVQLFRWTDVEGTFTAINGIDLGGGLFWDTSKLYSDGIIIAVPEPSSVMVALIIGTGLIAWNIAARRKELLPSA